MHACMSKSSIVLYTHQYQLYTHVQSPGWVIHMDRRLISLPGLLLLHHIHNMVIDV